MVDKQANNGGGGGCIIDVDEGGGGTSSSVPADISPALSSPPSRRPPATRRAVQEELLSFVELRGSSALESACRSLRASLSLRKLAIRWQRCVLEGQPEQDLDGSSVALSLVCAQYQLRANVRRVLRDCSAPVSILAMLRAAHTSLYAFCRVLRNFVKSTAAKELGDSFRVDAVNFVSEATEMFCLFQEYKVLFERKLGATSRLSDVFLMGWLLFVNVEDCISASSPDRGCLRQSNYLLLHCVVERLSSQSRHTLTHSGFDWIEDTSLRQAAMTMNISHFVPYLQEAFRSDLLEHVSVESALSSPHSLPPSICSAEVVGPNIIRLGHCYDQSLSRSAMCSFRLDKRAVLEGVEPLQFPESNEGSIFAAMNAVDGSKLTLSAGTLQSNSSCFRASSLPVRSVFPIVAPAPPSGLCIVMQNITWLNQVCESQSTHPSPSLQAHFLNCRMNPAASISANVQEFCGRSDFGGVCSATRGFRRELTIKLFYKTLEHIVARENNRLLGTDFDFSEWLGRDSFTTAVMAFAFELVVFSYTSPSTERAARFAFESLGAPPLDMFKVRRVVLRALPTMPATLRTHVERIEQCLFQRLAWDPRSSLLTLLRRRELNEFASACLTPDTLEWHKSPEVAPPDRPSSDKIVTLSFIRRLVWFSDVRVHELVNSANLRAMAPFHCVVRSVLLNVVLEQSNLLMNRRLDTFILCSVYIVGRLASLDCCQTFSDIVEAFMVADGTDNTTAVLDVPMSQGPSLSLPHFYNTEFLPRMRPFIFSHVRANVERIQKEPPKKDNYLPTMFGTRAHPEQLLLTPPRKSEFRDRTPRVYTTRGRVPL